MECLRSLPIKNEKVNGEVVKAGVYSECKGCYTNGVTGKTVGVPTSIWERFMNVSTPNGL